ncbi:MAG TPA: acetyl-CoA carboxylase biotin carboxyl carrier protein subunit, partial [Bacteroidales bacterium]|nr:acetyl-CoA carboxylase biotin carboxyl carrier protein subunit [Bacteroidales bacterium]
MKKYNLTIHGNQYEVNIASVEDNIAEIEVNGTNYTVEVDKVIQQTKTPKIVRQTSI